MNEADRRSVIADESARDRAYDTGLVEKARRSQANLNQNVANTWTEAPQTRAERGGELIGRVALDSPHPDVDGAFDFYIGSARFAGDGFTVFSWTAPVAACTYFRGEADREQLESLRDAVVGVRVFGRHLDRIADYQDEVLVDEAPSELFRRSGLTVPRAPGRVSSSESVVTNPEVQDDDVIGHATSGERGAPANGSSKPFSGLRAPGLLRRQLAKPKSASMSTVLATLQPDQYTAITLPADAAQILQGHPGTGKTIIAVHRAAYLLASDSDRPIEAKPKGRVLIIGPTEEYVHHVQGALAKLIEWPSRYRVVSISTLLEELAGLRGSTVPTVAPSREVVGAELAELVDTAVARLRKRGDGRPEAAAIYGELVGFLQDPPNGTLDAEFVALLRTFPQTHSEALRLRSNSLRGILAYVGVRAKTPPNAPGHVIVDEAQDLHPIEWLALARLGNVGGWTIMGDLNQRRNDHSYGSWQGPATLLGIDEDGRAPVRVLERGYRSTAQIIRFANQLLPARDRGLVSLQQDGEWPTFDRVTPAPKLPERALVAVDDHCARPGVASVALIAMDPAPAGRLLARRGWTAAAGDQSSWSRGGSTLRLLSPERARGLEFDAVVVVEPAEFPENVGRLGVLYTALTRANRFLTVVHHRGLPGQMRKTP